MKPAARAFGVSITSEARRDSLQSMLIHLRIITAAVYWLFVVFVFVASHYADPVIDGGFVLLLVDLPWSALLLVLERLLVLFKEITDFIPLTTEGWNFFLFVILCAGLNGVWIVGISRVVRWFRGGWQRTLVVTASMIALVVAAEIAMPMVNRDAVERRRPQNVPEDAAHLSSGFWQRCPYHPATDVGSCEIWFPNGQVSEEGEFAPYDGGVVAASD